MLKRNRQSHNTWLSRHGTATLVVPRGLIISLVFFTALAIGSAIGFGDPSPGNFQLIWARQWCDNHFLPYPGDSGGYGLAIDEAGYIYFSGFTRGGEGLYHAFIVKTDQDLNEIWYRRDYIPPNADRSGISRLAIATDGDLIGHATAVIDGQGYVRVLKVNSSDGSVIWQTDVPKPNTGGCLWAGPTGPVLDRWGNIYVSSSNSTTAGWTGGDPIGIYKFDYNGNLLWHRADSLPDHHAGANGWSDTWELVVDSEGSVYVSAQANIPGHQFDWGLVKYDTWGNHAWTRVTNPGGGWDNPRGLAIDSLDHIYQSGNAWRAHIIVFDTEGNTLDWVYLTDQSVEYPFGTAVDKDDNLVIHGVPEQSPYISEITKYSRELVKIASVQYEFPNRNSGSWCSRTAVDLENNVYCLQFFTTTDRPERQIGIIKVGTPPAFAYLSWLGTQDYESDGVSPDSGAVGSELVFKVKYTNPAGQAPSAVKLQLALDGVAVSGSPYNMLNESGATDWASGVVFTLPVTLRREGTYTYRFRAYDLSGVEVATCPSVSEPAKPGPTVILILEHTFWAGRRMVGIPVQVPGSPTMEELLDGTDAVWWDPQGLGYVTIGQPTPYVLGRGYWAQFDQETQVQIAGTGVTGELSYHAQDGWNIISSPYDAEIGLESITAVPTLRPFAWTDQGNGYELVAPITDSLNLIYNTLKPWWGYWVLSDGNGTITWNQTSPTAQQLQPLRMGRASAEQGGWQIQLTAKAGSRVDLCNYCGVADEQTAQALSIANPPAATDSVDLYFPTQLRPMASDIQPLSEGKLTWEFEVRCNLRDAEVTVGYPDLSVVPNDYRLILTDLDAERSVYMGTTQGYSYSSGSQGGVRHFQITAEPKSESSLLITGVTTQQVTGQRAAITYTLSTAAAVDIQIRNIAGRLIRRMQNDKLEPAGTHTATWNLANSAGSRVPRGTYLCVITARTEEGQQASCLRTMAVNR